MSDNTTNQMTRVLEHGVSETRLKKERFIYPHQRWVKKNHQQYVLFHFLCMVYKKNTGGNNGSYD